MTPGQIITAFEIAAGLGIAVLAASRQQRAVMLAALLAVLAVALTRLFKATIPHELHFAAWGALWVSSGGWVIRLGILRAASLPVAVAGGLFIFSGLCYAAADWGGAATVFLSAPMVAADMLVFAGLSALLWGAASGKRRKSLAYRERMARNSLGAHLTGGAGLARRARVGSDGQTAKACRRAGGVSDNSEVA